MVSQENKSNGSFLELLKIKCLLLWKAQKLTVCIVLERSYHVCFLRNRPVKQNQPKKEFGGYWFVVIATTIATRMQESREKTKKSTLNKKTSIGQKLALVFITKGLARLLITKMW